jgi:probable phosphoglycerate mutase/uncharacterized phosphatase
MQSPLPTLLPPIPFYFLRHGETDWNVIKKLQSRTDNPLNATGMAQAQQAAMRVSTLGIETIISSPLKRAAVTAQTIQAHLTEPSLVFDDALIEQSYGSFEGRLRTDLEAEFGAHFYTQFWRYLPADAESIEAFNTRVLQATRKHLTQAQGRTLLFVGHGGFMGNLAAQLGIGEPQHFANAVPYLFTPTATGWQLKSIDRHAA